MNLLRTMIGALVIVVAGTPAQASDPVVAKLERALQSPLKVIAGGSLFRCELDRCEATAPTNQTSSLRSCKQLAERVGPIIEFGGSRTKMGPEKLKACNAAAE